MFRDRAYFRSLLVIAVPIVLQNFVSASLNMIDVMMIGQMGETAVAAVGLANQVFFLLTFVLFGITSGSAVFSAQLWGNGDIPNLRRVLGAGLTLGVLSSVVFSLAAIFAPRWALGVYTEDLAVIDLGEGYLRTVGFSYMFTAVSFAYAAVMRSTGNTRVPMVTSILAIGLKTGLNYVLIFGLFGAPKLGVEGAAISTVISRLVECTALLALIYWKKLPAAASPRELFSFKLSFLKPFLKTALPVAVNETLWAAGISAYNAVYAHIGTEAIAAVNIVSTIESLSFVAFIGISDACGIMIGNSIGAGEEHKAADIGRKSLGVATIGGVAIGVLVLLFSPLILQFYNLSDAALENARAILTMVGFVLWVRVSNMTLIVGILRAGGDTRFGLFLDAGAMWLIGVPLALLGAFVLRWPVAWVYLLVMAEEFGKYFIALWRFFSGRWVRNLTQSVTT